jgi:TolA-binding protein
VTAPQRLIEADDEFERELIRSAHSDRPSSRALERTLLGLGVELVKLPSAMAGSAASGTLTGKITGTVLAKWLVTGVAIGVAGITGAQAVGHALEQHARHMSAAPQRAAARPNAHATTAADRVASPPPPENRLSVAASAPSASAPGAPLQIAANPILEVSAAPIPRTPPPVVAERSLGAVPALPAVGSFALEAAHAPPPRLADEMRLLDAARRVLASGEPRSALASLDNYERAFPSGALRPEASVLKVRALLAAGERASAEALAQRIILRAPRSEHADAVRAELARRSNP